jgi:plasmid stabilization system protein ParE
VTRIIYRPEAESDIEAAFDWYESREAGLGQEFREEIEAAEGLIARSPLAFKSVLGNARRCFLQRFPYLLVFVVDGEDIMVLGCFHARTSTATRRRRARRGE